LAKLFIHVPSILYYNGTSGGRIVRGRTVPQPQKDYTPDSKAADGAYIAVPMYTTCEETGQNK